MFFASASLPEGSAVAEMAGGAAASRASRDDITGNSASPTATPFHFQFDVRDSMAIFPLGDTHLAGWPVDLRPIRHTIPLVVAQWINQCRLFSAEWRAK